jgi:branched-chain amino acid aminotransferase
VSVKIYIDGVITGEADAKISVFDRGFLYGDSVYEVARTSGGRPVDYERHIDRLERSAASIWLPCPSREVLAAAVRETLAAADNPESYVRIILTRGAGDIGLDLSLAENASTIVIARPLATPVAALYETGAVLRIVGVRRTAREAINPEVKSGNYLNNILALAEARRHGAHEGVMLSTDGTVAEGSTSNVFAVTGGALYTPAVAVGLLPGITRLRVIELALGAGLAVVETDDLTPDALREADEVFITSSIRTILPISRVDDVDIAAPGPITSRLAAFYSEFLAAEAARGLL